MTVLDACTTAEDGGSLPHCHNNGVCENGSHGDSPGTFSCVCPAGFTGPTCQQGLTSSFLSCPLLLSPFFTLSWLLSHRRCLLVYFCFSSSSSAVQTASQEVGASR